MNEFADHFSAVALAAHLPRVVATDASAEHWGGPQAQQVVRWRCRCASAANDKR
ncbi:MAG TPA: hypothetical protein VK420_12160 [Longimicrobium sp.]|nr:hypothetical protein [Longimicrobium sp.]